MQLSAGKDIILFCVSEMHVCRRYFLIGCLLGNNFFLFKKNLLYNNRGHKTNANYQLINIFSLLGPIIELQEIELADLWGGLDEQEVCEELSEKLVLSQTEISEGEILAYQPVGDNRQGTYRMRTGDREGLFEQMGMSGAETGGFSKEENPATESSDAELRKEGEDAASAVKSTDFEARDLDGDTTYSEKSIFQEDIKTERQTESASADRQEEDFPGSASTGYSLSRDGEPGSGKQVDKEEFSLGREPDTETNREEDYHILDREPGSEGQVSQEEENLIAQATNTISEPASETITVTSEDRAVADMDIIASKQDAPVAEVVKETPARKESFSRQQGSQFDQQTSSETRLQNEDLVQDQGKGKAFSFILEDLNLFQHMHLDWFNYRCVYNPFQNC